MLAAWVSLWVWAASCCCAIICSYFTKPHPTNRPPALHPQIATETSLRYAIQLIATAAVSAGRRKAAEVGTEDVAKAYSLFLDVRRSVQLLHEHADEYVGNEAAGGGAGMDVA